jgi:tryptophan synthase alpha chain
MRLDSTFATLRRERRTGLVTYVTAGDPSLAASGDVLKALDRAGADVLEVGVPFSDPLADGPVIQRASERALAAGATLAGVLDLVARERANIKAPIVAFSYANPILRMGLETFTRRAAAAGVDGVLVLDLPIDEAEMMQRELSRAGIDTVFLLSPTSTTDRIRRAAALGRGFLYAISRLGVTGARDSVAHDAKELVSRIRAETQLPVALGFGVSRPEHVSEIGQWADAAVVGSGLVDVIARHGRGADLVSRVEEYVRWMKSAVPGTVGGRGSSGPA